MVILYYAQILQLAQLLGLDQDGDPYDSMVGVAIGRGQPMSEGRGHPLILVTLDALEVSVCIHVHMDTVRPLITGITRISFPFHRILTTNQPSCCAPS